MTSTGICCPSGQAPSGPNKSQCNPIVLIPIKTQSAMLFGRPDTGAQRRVLRGGKRDVEGRLLPGGDYDAGPLELPGANSSHYQKLRVRLHEDAGRELLQQSLPQLGRQKLRTPSKCPVRRDSSAISTVFADRSRVRLVRPARSSVATAIACRLGSLLVRLATRSIARAIAFRVHSRPARRAECAMTKAGVCRCGRPVVRPVNSVTHAAFASLADPAANGHRPHVAPIRPPARFIPPRQFRPPPFRPMPGGRFQR